MTRATFPEANTIYGPPVGVPKSQVAEIQAYVGTAVDGPLDGTSIVVVAWQPLPEDLARLNAGGPVYLTCVGGLPPHMLNTTFAEAVRS